MYEGSHQIQDDFSQNQIPYVILIIGGIVVLALICAVTLLCYTSAKRREKLKLLETELLATPKQLDPILPIFDQIDNLSFDPLYELPLSSLYVDRTNLKTLGRGQFGRVVLGVYTNELSKDESVAIKRTRSSWDPDQYRMLFKEICLMANVGRHPNVVNMIGAITQISHGHLYMVLEYCANGSLMEFILKRVEEYGFNDELVKDPVKDEQYKHEDLEAIHLSVKESESKLRTADLLAFAYQIACGMEYVASVKFIHRDLAARNVLLTADLIAKISDFGLGQQDYQFYEKDKSVLLPVRWLAPEAILFHKFSIRSDVWSFGVTLGEIFSLGAVPFANYSSVNKTFAEQLSKGAITLTRPTLAPQTVYNLMLNCCTPEPKYRWSFTRCKDELKAELSRCDQEFSDNLQAKLDSLADQLMELQIRESSKKATSKDVEDNKQQRGNLWETTKNVFTWGHRRKLTPSSLQYRYHSDADRKDNKYV